MQKKMI